MEQILSVDDVLAALKEKGCCCGVVNPDVYHAMKPMLEEALGVPVLSKSSLCDFMQSPYRYHWQQENGGKEKTASMALGSLVDCLVLTPGLFEDQYLCEEKKVAVKKDGTPYANGMQDSEQKARWEAAAAEGVTVISREQLQRGQDIAKCALAHLEHNGLRREESYVSQVGMWVYLTELDGEELVSPVVLTGMIDILPTDRAHADELWDLKTTSVDVCSTVKLEYTMRDYHYGIQAAMYLDLYNLATEEARSAFTFLFVGTVGEPVLSRKVCLSAEVVDIYRAQYRKEVRNYCLAWKMNDWGTPLLDTHMYMPSKGEWLAYGKEMGV
jgi:hypothetical protein